MRGGRVIVVMGVTSTGKSTVGRLLAERLGARFAEGDAYHPPANVLKMRGGVPLDDVDRRPWLESIAADAKAWLKAGETAVVACSALKRAYRDVLRGAGPGVRFVHLTGPEALVAARMAARRGHYMPPSLLPSQLAALEPPGTDEGAVEVGIDEPPEAIAERVLALIAPAAPA